MYSLFIVAVIIALLSVFAKNTFNVVVLFAGFITTIASVGICNGYVVQSVIAFICYMSVNVLLIGIFYWKER